MEVSSAQPAALSRLHDASRRSAPPSSLSAASKQLTAHANPVPLDTPTDTPHDLYCLARDYERQGRLADAADLYLKASMNGHLAAMVSYASHLLASDEKAAFVWFRAAAERGDARAWAELGQLLARGRYFEVNAIDAARCWKRAAQMGDNTGKSALGLCYIRGFGVRQDPAKGVEIVKQVADVHNDVTAMKNLAWIYRHGKGVPKNLEEAAYWERRAKEQNLRLVSISSKEQALFGRGRSKHPKYRSTKDDRNNRPPVYGDVSQNTGVTSDAHATVLQEADMRDRLRNIADDPARQKSDTVHAVAEQVTNVTETERVELHQAAPEKPKTATTAVTQVPFADSAQALTQLSTSTRDSAPVPIPAFTTSAPAPTTSGAPHCALDSTTRPATVSTFTGRATTNEAGAGARATVSATTTVVSQETTSALASDTTTHLLPQVSAAAATLAPPTSTTFVQQKYPESEPERPVGAKAYGATAAGATAVATAVAVSSSTVNAAKTEGQTLPETATNRAQELQRSAVEAFQQTIRKGETSSEVVVQDLDRASGVNPIPTNAEQFGVLQSELRPVRQETPEEAAEEAYSPTESRGGSSSTGQDESIDGTSGAAVESSEQIAETSGDAADGSDDQFLTPPEQSEESEKHGSSGIVKRAAGAIGVAATGTAAALGIQKSGHTADSNLSSTSEAMKASTVGMTQDALDKIEYSEHSGPKPEARRDGQFEKTPSAGEGDYSEYVSHSVESRTRMLEETVAAAAASKVGLPRAKSYSLNGADAAPSTQQSSSHLDEFEQADMRRMTTDVIGTNPTYAASASVGCKITKASSFAKETSTSREQSRPLATERPATENLKEVPESRFSSEIQSLPKESRSALMKEGSGFIDEPMTQQPIEEVLELYPKNPLRSDSQVPLFRILEAIQNVPADDAESYEILDRGQGFSKVVVAMLSQHEDGAIQEQGLHCIVRILRNTPPSLKENLVMASYGDCYRNVQGSMDAVVPKGSLEIDERSSGAIQAIVQALRNFESMRRVQLAGCAALAEVGSVSRSCKAVAAENGAIPLVITALRHRSTQAASSIHDIASRTVSAFCSGKENLDYKQSFSKAEADLELLNVLQLWGHVEGNASELLTTATKSFCAALRHVTDGCPSAGIQCVQAYGYHHLIRVLAVKRDDVAVCTLVVSAMTSITRSSGATAEKGLQDAKPLREVLITMQAHSDQPLFIRKCLDFMDALGCYSSMREEIVAAGGIPFAADIIEQGGNDSLLLERSCSVLEKLCRSNARNQEILASHNGISSLTSLLTTHQGLPSVIEKDLLALGSVCASNGKTQKEALKMGTPEQVVRSLGVYSSQNAKVAAAAAATMAAMVVPRNASMAQSFANLKAPDLIVRAMKRHPDSVTVQENGSAAISSFCEADPRIISILLKSGLSSVLVVALQRYLHKQTAVVQIVRAMRAISNEASEDSKRFKYKLITDRSNESSLSEIFHTALSYHKKSLPDAANVIISICATINRLCMRSVAFKNEIGKDGIVEELKRLVERTAEYRELGALQPVLATICTLVLDSEENKNRFHAVGGVEAILDVMQKWKNDTYVLEHCCAALRYSCNEHFGNCDEVKRHNGVRSILGVMELHPDNVNVTLWCCLTLADLCKGDEELQSSPNVVQGIRKVVSAMSTFSGNSRFLASACEFLRAASLDNADNLERIVRLGGRAAIVRALEAHPSDSTLTEAAAYALLQVQDVQGARISADGDSQVGFVKRLSRDLRRSSSSNRSTRSGLMGGIFGLKSRSFISKRKATEHIEEEGRLSEGAEAEVVPDRTPTTRPSLISFSRRSKGSRRTRRNYVDEEDIENEDEVEQFAGGADPGYGEYDAAPAPVAASGPPLE